MGRDSARAVPGLSRAEIERTMMSVLDAFQPDALMGRCPVDIEVLYEIDLPRYYQQRYGEEIQTGYGDLSAYPGEVLGVTDTKRRISLVERSLMESPNRSRRRQGYATCAHEASHVLLHMPLGDFESLSVTTGLFRASEGLKGGDPEWQAWWGARALAMPAEVIQGYMRSGLSERHIAERMDLNPAFVRMRMRDLQKI